MIAALEAAQLRGEARRNTPARIAELRSDEGELVAKIAKLTDDRVTLEQYQREAAASRTIYEYFLARLKETTVQQGIQQADARLLSAALVPDIPSSPRPLLSALLGAAVAMIVAAGVAVLAEMRTATFRTADALELASGLPVLGQIPRIPTRRRQKVLDYIRRKPTSAAVEAMRNLRTSILMADGNTAPQVIVSTSSLPGEGKTTQTLALAQTFAAMGRRVLVVEGDVRKRVFQDYFGTPDCGSLLRVLTAKQTLTEAVWHSAELEFDILFGEAGGASAADIFSTNAFRRLIEAARAEYDVVLIDTPPVLLVPDARVIARHADAVIYTVRWDKTREKQVRAGLRSLQIVGIRVTGLVLGQINQRGMKRYGYGKDFGTYGNSGYYAN
jgi:capsular exopolysaccharide synthesis family protein